MVTNRGRALSLRTPGFEDLSLDAAEFVSLQGAKGFGVAPRTNRWFEGASDGAVWRSGKSGRRVLQVPVLIRGADVDALEDNVSALAARFAPSVGLSRLLLDEGESRGVWYVDVAYSDGLDWTYGKDTDGTRWVQVTLVLEAGDPFWTRVQPESIPIGAAGAGRGLLKGVTPLSALRQASGQTMGTVTFVNPGPARAYPVTTIYGPATGATLTSAGLTMTWTGTLAAGQRRVFDHRAGTLIDPDAVGDQNRYSELGPAPKFWPVEPGTSQATVALTGDTPGVSRVLIEYNPRRWLVM